MDKMLKFKNIVFLKHGIVIYKGVKYIIQGVMKKWIEDWEKFFKRHFKKFIDIY